MNEGTSREADWLNVVPGKPSAQSSRPGHPVFGQGVETAEEDSPWWTVDLGSVFPLEAITVHNRRDGPADQNRTLSIEVACETDDWITLHAGLVYFGSGSDAPPLHLPLSGRVKARRVRLKLHERGALCVSQVKVMVEAATARAVDIRREHGFSFLTPGEQGGQIRSAYEVVAATPHAMKGKWIGLDIAFNCAFGNCLVQYANALVLARNLGLTYIRCGAGGLVSPASPIVADGITLLPAGTPLPEGGCFLRGDFFYQSLFKAALEGTSAEHHEAIRKIGRKLFNGIPFDKTAKPDAKTLTIHVRSGDIFSTNIHNLYVQPPLSFYQMAVERMTKEKGVKRVKLVFEDRQNPVIDALEAWLKARGIPCNCRSGSLEDDITALIDAPHLVFGRGSFGRAICHLSSAIETVWYFTPSGRCLFADIPNIRHVIQVTDTGGGYIRVGAWANTPEQHRQMIEYPAENIGVTGEWKSSAVSSVLQKLGLRRDAAIVNSTAAIKPG